ncbi:MAG TPA: hypothetical protein VL001_11005 [Candidimonas sp.]|nr:hypothetical protein [Candidimonas sp.]
MRSPNTASLPGLLGIGAGLASCLVPDQQMQGTGGGGWVGEVAGAPRGVLRLRMQGCGVFERGAYGQPVAARSREFRSRLKRSATRG